jgi:hypothetical protein
LNLVNHIYRVQMINRNCLGGEEADLRDTFFRIRFVQVVIALFIIAFIVLLYFLIDCYITSTVRQCIGTTIILLLFGFVLFCMVVLIIRWKWCWKEIHVQEEEPRSYGEITPKKITIGNIINIFKIFKFFNTFFKYFINFFKSLLISYFIQI